MLLVQNEGEMAVLPAVTAVQFHQNAMDTWIYCNDVVQCRGVIAVLSAITAILLH